MCLGSVSGSELWALKQKHRLGRERSLLLLTNGMEMLANEGGSSTRAHSLSKERKEWHRTKARRLVPHLVHLTPCFGHCYCLRLCLQFLNVILSLYTTCHSFIAGDKCREQVIWGIILEKL